MGHCCKHTTHSAYLNFCTCAHIQERLHHSEDHAEAGRCIDDASLAKHLWIVVGIQRGDLAQHLLHAAHLLDAHTCSQIVNDEMTRLQRLGEA